MRLVEIYPDGTSKARELAPHEVHEITAEVSRISSADLTRDVQLSQLAQIFINGMEMWRSSVPEVSQAVEQGRVITKVASDEVKLRDQAG
jgi:hypothetical protein